MGIVFVFVGKVDQKVIPIVKDDQNKIFGKQVWTGKGMPEPHLQEKREISICPRGS